MEPKEIIHLHHQEIGRKGGLVKSEKKAQAARRNGRKHKSKKAKK